MQINVLNNRSAHFLDLLRSAQKENQTERIRILMPGPKRISSANLCVSTLHSTKNRATNISIVQEITINRIAVEEVRLAFLSEMENKMKISRLIRNNHPINIAGRVPMFANM